MASPKNRAVNRQDRQQGKKNRKNHEPLLRLTQQEVTKRPVKPSAKELKPLTEAQRAYDASIRVNTIAFGVGPAGTGKTWWAAMRAAEALRNEEIERIIITRPAVEAEEENLGFLPGDELEKYEPYFRPVRDALEEYLGTGTLEYMIKAKIIEARPMAYLRGSTLKNCWVIADEMQNATKGQLKLLLTRIGENAKYIINGDPTQCDLPDPEKSGLLDAVSRLGSIKGVGVTRFERCDIVRSAFCQAIVEAYESPARIHHENRYSTSDSDSDREGVERFLRV